MMNGSFRKMTASVFALLLVVGVAACGGEQRSVQRPLQPDTATVRGADGGEVGVERVIGKPGAPVTISYTLATVPVVGVTSSVLFEFVAQGAADVMELTFSADQGLQLMTPLSSLRYEQVVAGQRQAVQVELVPQRNGTFNVNAFVTMRSGDRSSVRVYGVAVVVGGSPPQLRSGGVEKPGGRGETVISLPAVETIER
ncbi:MAG: hypothetical protein GXP10_10890 [Gammaproteobacteria bacterium]|nr:hypothetical protein [Gammaproteobacteria bacterium]